MSVILTSIITLLGTSFAFMNFDTKKITTGNSGVSVSSSDGNKLEIFKESTGLEKVSGTDYSKIEMSAKAVLTTTSTYTDTYSLYYNVEENGFKDSAEENKVLLKIVKPDGTELTELEGYLRKTVGDISGFDITNEDEQIAIFEDKEITTDSLVEEEWEFVVYIDDSDEFNYDVNLVDSNNLSGLSNSAVYPSIAFGISNNKEKASGSGSGSFTIVNDGYKYLDIDSPSFSPGYKGTAGLTVNGIAITGSVSYMDISDMDTLLFNAKMSYQQNWGYYTGGSVHTGTITLHN